MRILHFYNLVGGGRKGEEGREGGRERDIRRIGSTCTCRLIGKRGIECLITTMFVIVCIG